MKKYLVFVLITILLFAMICVFASCNKQVFDFNYQFKKAYCRIGDEWYDLDIRTWTDFDDGEQIQLTLEDGTVFITSSYNCILYNGELPGINGK